MSCRDPLYRGSDTLEVEFGCAIFAQCLAMHVDTQFMF